MVNKCFLCKKIVHLSDKHNLQRRGAEKLQEASIARGSLIHKWKPFQRSYLVSVFNDLYIHKSCYRSFTNLAVPWHENPTSKTSATNRRLTRGSSLRLSTSSSKSERNIEHEHSGILEVRKTKATYRYNRIIKRRP